MTDGSREGRRIIRSTEGSGARGVLQPQGDDADELGEQAWWWSPPPEVVEYEESLPTDGDADQDYDERWDDIWDWSVDDSAEWERLAFADCTSCGQRAEVDPMGTCRTCRRLDGRCSWCGLDSTVYAVDDACRTCYQRIRRAGFVTSDLAMRVAMLNAAFRRADLRKGRS